jgi:hypothetical protein
MAEAIENNRIKIRLWAQLHGWRATKAAKDAQ